MSPLARKGAGRPPAEVVAARTEEEVAQAEIRRRDNVINKHRADCVRLRKVISAITRGKDTEELAKMSTSDVQRLSATTKQLHEIERQAYDMGADTNKIVAVIMLPPAAEDMAGWQKMASKVMPAHQQVAGPGRTKRIEPDIEGDVPAPPEEEADYDELDQKVGT